MYRLGQSEELTAHREVCCKDSTGTVITVLYGYLSTFFEKLFIKKKEMGHVQTEKEYKSASRKKLIIEQIWGGSRISGGSAQEKVQYQHPTIIKAFLKCDRAGAAVQRHAKYVSCDLLFPLQPNFDLLATNNIKTDAS